MLRDKVIEIFVKVDDFCKEIVPMLEEKRIEDKKLGRRNRKAGLSESEIIRMNSKIYASCSTPGIGQSIIFY